MKKPWLIVSLLVLVWLVAREFYPVPQEPAPAPAVSSKRSADHTPKPSLPAAPAIEAPAARPSPTLGKTLAPQQSKSGERPKPPPNSIPFELHNGLVVSYGDVLLGRPTHEDFPENGFIEAPKVKYWESEIAYSLDPNLPNPDRVHRVIAYFNEHTPVRFVPFTNQKDSIVFSPSEVDLCLSYVGKIGGHQPIYLDDRCYEKEVTHELMHALGFIHEHSRPDRDQFVRVNWDNIEEDKQSQFEAAPLSMAQPHKGRPFDFQSIMIYDPTAFAKQRGDFTIESLSGAKIEPMPSGLSPEDLARLVILYGR